MSIQEDEAPIVEEATGDLASDLARLTALKRQKADLEAEISYLQDSLLNEFETSVSFTENNALMKATIVRSESFDVDINTLAQLNPSLYNEVTKRVLDNTAFKRFVSTGLLSPDVVQKVVTIKPKAAFIKISKFNPEEAND